MTDVDWTEFPIPTLMRSARGVYAQSIRAQLQLLGVEDLPRNGAFILAGIDNERGPVAGLPAELGVTKQASGQLVTDLEKRGYVRREDHPQGGRRRLIVLTDKALAHLQSAGAILHQLESEIAARAGDGTLPALRAELTRLIRAMTGDRDIPPLRPLW